MRRFNFVFMFFVSCGLLLSQPQTRSERPAAGSKPIYIEHHISLVDSINHCFVFFRIPYSNLVFVKIGDDFSGGLTFRIEATTKEGVEARESVSEKVTVSDFRFTTSSEKYLEGMLSFALSKDQLIINPMVELHNINRQIPLKPFEVKNELSTAIVVKEEPGNCSNSIGFSLTNYENIIPFGDEDYHILFPVYDAEIDKLIVTIKQDDKEIKSTEILPAITSHLNFAKCGKGIEIIDSKTGVSSNLFLLDQFSYLLEEGDFWITVEDETGKEIIRKQMDVIWTDKPRSLLDEEKAFELLSIVEGEENLESILDSANDDYSKALELFWDKYDPNNETPFNQLKSEFYSRADKAMKEYSTNGKRFSKLSDRGQIYVKYGKPSDINRFYTEKNEIAEVWQYQSPKLKFVFVDVSGLGNYKLVN